MSYIGNTSNHYQYLDTITNPSLTVDINTLNAVIDHKFIDEKMRNQILEIFEKRSDAFSTAVDAISNASTVSPTVIPYYLDFIANYIKENWIFLDEINQSKFRSLLMDKIIDSFKCSLEITFPGYCKIFIELLKKDFPIPIDNPFGQIIENIENPSDDDSNEFIFCNILHFFNILNSYIILNNDSNHKMQVILKQAQEIAFKTVLQIPEYIDNYTVKFNLFNSYIKTIYYFMKFLKSDFIIENNLIQQVVDLFNYKFVQHSPFQPHLVGKSIDADIIKVHALFDNFLLCIGSFFNDADESLEDEYYKILIKTPFVQLIQNLDMQYKWLNDPTTADNALSYFESLLISCVKHHIKEIPDIDILFNILIQITQSFCEKIQQKTALVTMISEENQNLPNKRSINDDSKSVDIVFKHCLSIISQMINLINQDNDDQSNSLIQEKYVPFISDFLNYFVENCISYKMNSLYDALDFSKDEFVNETEENLKIIKKNIIHNSYLCEELDFEENIHQLLTVLSHGYEKSKYETLAFILLSLQDILDSDENSEIFWNFMDLTVHFLESKSLNQNSYLFVLQVFYKFIFVFHIIEQNVEQYFDMFLKFLMIDNKEIQKVSINSFLKKINENGWNYITKMNKKYSMPFYMILISKYDDICSNLLDNDLIYDFLESIYTILFNTIDKESTEKESSDIYKSIRQPIYDKVVDLISRKDVYSIEWLNSFDLYFSSLTIVSNYDKWLLPYFNSNYSDYINIFIELSEEVNNNKNNGMDFSLLQRIKQKIVEFFLNSIILSEQIKDSGLPLLVIDHIFNDFISSREDLKIEEVIDLISTLFTKCSDLFASKIENIYKTMVSNIVPLLIKQLDSVDESSSNFIFPISFIEKFIKFLNSTNIYMNLCFDTQIVNSFLQFLWKYSKTSILKDITKEFLRNFIKEIPFNDVFLLIHDQLNEIITNSLSSLFHGLENDFIPINSEIVRNCIICYTSLIGKIDISNEINEEIHLSIYSSLSFYDDETRIINTENIIQASKSEESFSQQIHDILTTLFIIE